MRRPLHAGQTGCAAIADGLDEPLGSGLERQRLLCLEHTAAWGPDAPGDGPLPPDAARELARRCDALGIRLQLLRRSQRPAAPGPSTCLLVWAQEHDRRVERLDVEHPSDILGLDFERFASPGSRGFGQPVDGPVWLVCTHGKKDPCCASRGRPLVRALRAAGQDVWQTSHLGGDRFAPNAVVLPHGVQLGRVPAADARRVAAHLAAGRLPLELLRGRIGLPGVAQVAERIVRRGRGLDGLHDIELVDVIEHSGGERADVRLLVQGQPTRIALAEREQDGVRPTTCRDGEPGAPTHWAPIALEREQRATA